MSWKLVMQECGLCQDHSTTSGAVERKCPPLSFCLFATVLLVLLIGQTSLKPESRRAWEAWSKVSSSRTQSSDGEDRVDLGVPAGSKSLFVILG